ncbi:hypothetical protein [Amycolatopsis alkalitolerans]|uniref:Uncharacterized protein n=1 Tax=Amycolatopsis alkalitolerans TaxID=2547244 RepID=A0A5C4M453_9PSEU|nr:hypothetical protein [Amycolatopsis alkalitolerans]TNC26030.1 hypothetical protein FG385_12680 [Amycolatopsis alkalitolerans]
MQSQAQWQGDGANAYAAFATGLKNGSGLIPPSLSQVSGAIRSYATTLQAAQEKVASAGTSAQHASTNNDQNGVAAAKGDAATANKEVEDSARETSGKLGEVEEQLNKVWEGSEPVRAWLEKLHAPWDVVNADKWLDMAVQKGESATEALEKWTKEMPEHIGNWWREMSPIAHDAENGLISWDEVEAAAAKVGTKIDAAKAFTQQWAQDIKWVAPATNLGKAAGFGMGVAGIAGDAFTMISPPDKGAMGNVDRAAAGVNGALLVANMATDEIPVAGEVTMAATGIYLGGNYLYHHWGAFHDACNAVGHGAVTAGKAIGHAASSAWHAVSSWL